MSCFSRAGLWAITALSFVPILSCCGPGDEVVPRGSASTPDQVSGIRSKILIKEFVVDIRNPEEFAIGHAAEAVNLQWGYGQFELRVARVFPAGSRLQITGDDADQVAQAVALAKNAGFEAVAAEPPPNDVRFVDETMSVDDLKQRLADRSITVLDTRTAKEYADGHIAGALFVYPDDIGTVAPVLAVNRPIAVICEAGWRSSLVTSYLRRMGFPRVYNVIEGMNGWQAAGLPVETGDDQKAWK